MALIFTDGFDHYNTPLQKWTTAAGANAPVMNSSFFRTGTQSVRLNATTLGRQVLPAQEHATFCAGFAIYFLNSTPLHFEFRSDSNATIHVRTVVTPGVNVATVGVYRGASATLLASVSGLNIPLNSWSHIGVKATLHDTTGAVDVYLNGTNVLSATGLDTKNAGTKAVFDGVFFNESSFTSAYIDDFYLTNASGSVNTGFIGDCKIETLYPNAAGTTTGLTPSTGANYTTVDETPPNTTDYSGSATDELYDLYALANLTTTSGTVYGINIFAYSAKNDAGLKGGAIMLRTSSTDYERTSRSLATSYSYQNEIIENNPATSTAWTITEINALEAGFKVKAS